MISPGALARRRARDEGGFVLLLTIVIIGMFSIIAMVLLSMTLTDLRVRRTLSDNQRTAHAADSALVAALNKLQSGPSGAIGSPGSACSPTTLTIDALPVDVTCNEEGTPIGTTWDAAHPAVTVLGGFSGLFAGGTNAVFQGPLAAPLQLVFATIADWLNAHAPGLVHYGPAPVQTVGDVNVSKYGFGVTGPDNRSDKAFDLVDGRYRQADPSPYAVPGDPCGQLSASYAVPLFLSGYRFTAIPRALESSETSPLECTPASVPTPPVYAPPATTWATVNALPSCTAASAGTTITMPVGRYSTSQVQTLNAWLGASDACRNVTLLFPSGDYYLDASGTVPPVNGDVITKSAIVIDDPTISVVFGQPKGWVTPARPPASAFPEACDSTADGVSITLSSRTTIQHHQGLVAACGRRDASGNPTALVYQEVADTPVNWAAEPSGATSVANTVTGRVAFTTPANATASVGPVPAGFPTSGAAYDVSEGPGPEKSSSIECYYRECQGTIDFQNFFSSAPPLTGDLTVAKLRLRGSTTNAIQPPGALPCGLLGELDRCSSTTVTLALHDDPADRTIVTRTCTVKRDGVPAAGAIFDIDIRPSCGVVSIDSDQLRHASISVAYDLKRTDQTFCDFWFFGTYIYCPPVKGSIDYVWLEASTLNAPPSVMEITQALNATRGPTSSNFFGPVYMPRNQIIVRWNGTTTRAPVFAGGVVATAIASATDAVTSTVGVLAAPRTKTIRRLRAFTGTGADRRLRASADVSVSERTTTVGGATVPIRHVEVLAWRLCDVSVSVAAEATSRCP